MKPPEQTEPGDAVASSTDDDASPGWARWVSRISFVVAVIAMVATIWAVGLGPILEHMRAIGVWFVAIVALEALSTFCDARAIHAMTRDHAELGFGRVLFAQIAGRAVNAVTPGGTLGEATKMTVLVESTSMTRAVAAVLFCSLASTVIQLVVIAIGAPLTALLLPLPDVLGWVLIGVGVIAGAIAVGLTVLVRRGMLSHLVGFAVKLGVLSKKRRDRWKKKLGVIDDRLRGASGGRRPAVVYVFLSKLVSAFSIWVILASAGYQVSAGMLAALLSAGVVLGWLASVVPLGLGVAESGNYALFRALGAPPAFGVTLALAKRVNQVLYAVLGFGLLATWRGAQKARDSYRTRRTARTAAKPA